MSHDFIYHVFVTLIRRAGKKERGVGRLGDPKMTEVDEMKDQHHEINLLILVNLCGNYN